MGHFHAQDVRSAQGRCQELHVLCLNLPSSICRLFLYQVGAVSLLSTSQCCFPCDQPQVKHRGSAVPSLPSLKSLQFSTH